VGRDRAAAFRFRPRARELLDELPRERPESPGVKVAEALWAHSQGEVGAARELLTSVVAAKPELRAALEQDPDLGHLMAEP
jgi:hypothetical protein